MMQRYLPMILLVAVTALLGGCEERKIRFVSIGTGGVTGVYYPTGGAISRMVNKKLDRYGIKSTVESTAGSVYNINAVMSGDLDFGIAQSDRQYQAFHGLAEWAENGRQTSLRSVFSIHPEAITLIASEKSGVRELRDIRGKRVNLGNPGSGQLQNSRDILAAAGFADGDIQAEYVKAVEAPGLLQDNRIDAFFYTVGHPNGNIKEATSGRIRVLIVPVRGSGIDSMIESCPYYAKTDISREFYPNALNTDDTESVGVKATLVTSEGVAEDIVYAITKEVFENFEEFRTLHPAYRFLEKEHMLQGLSAPIHVGALRYYEEAGLADHLGQKLR